MPINGNYIYNLGSNLFREPIIPSKLSVAKAFDRSRLVSHEIIVKRSENPDVKFLFNYINNAIKGKNVPAIIKAGEAKISTATRSQYKFIKNSFNKLGIKFKSN